MSLIYGALLSQNALVAKNDTVNILSYDFDIMNILGNDISPNNAEISILEIEGGTIGISAGPYEFNAFKVGHNNDSLAYFYSYSNAHAEFKCRYRCIESNNPAMISNWADIVIFCYPVQDSLLAMSDTSVIYSAMPDTVNILQNDFIPANDPVEKVFFIGSQENISVQNLNDTLVRLNSNSFYHGDQGFYYLVFTEWPPVSDNQPVSFATFDVTVLNRHLGDSLTINNINAGFSARGLHFWDLETENTYLKFEVPKGSGNRSIFSNSLWVGGMNDDTLYFAGERYTQNGKDFWTGPISENYQQADIVKYGVWKLNKSDIDYHISHYTYPDYEPIEAILTWPGNGNTALGQAAQLAPYFDNNSDGMYNAYDGDIPLIRGDQSLYFIYNDGQDIHTESLSQALNVEIHGNAFAFDNPEDSVLFNTVFVHYDIYNRSSKTYNNTCFGIFTDIDLGDAYDDYVGCNVEGGYYYGYNGDDVDGNGGPGSYGSKPPAQSVTIIGGPYMDEDGNDNPAGGCDESINGLNFGDGITDNERFGMTGFASIFNSFGPTGDPQIAPEYYNYLRGIWKDGIHMSYGGNAHPVYGAVGPDCNFMFPWDSDECNWGTNEQVPNGGFNQNGYFWNEYTSGNMPSDRRGLGVTGSFTFKPGDKQELDLAYVFARDYMSADTLASLTLLKERNSLLKEMVLNGGILKLPDYYNVGIEKGINFIQKLNLYPNPAGDFVYFDKNFNSNTQCVIYSSYGAKVFETILNQQNLQSINVSKLTKGIYVLKLISSNEMYFGKFLKY
jgi:hypothetical protein